MGIPRNLRRSLQALATVTLAAAGAALPTACAPDTNVPPPPLTSGGSDLATKLAADTGTSWVVADDPALGTPSFLAPKGKSSVVLKPGQKPEEAARGFLARYATELGVRDQAKDLVLEAEETGVDGLSYASFRQSSKGVPILGTRTSVVFDEDGAIAFVSSRVVPNVDGVGRAPALSPADALAKASKGRDVDPTGTTPATLAIDVASGGHDPRLVYTLQVTPLDGAGPRRVSVDAATGDVLLTESLVYRAHAPGVFQYLPNVTATASGKSRHVADDRTFSTYYNAAGTTTYMGRAEAGTAQEMHAYDASRLGSGSALCGTATDVDLTRARLISGPNGHWDDASDLVRTVSCGGSGSYTFDGRGVAPTAYPILERVDGYFRGTLGRRISALTGPVIKVYFHEKAIDENAVWSGGTAADGSPAGHFSIGDIASAEQDPVGGIDSRGLAVTFGAATDVLAHEYQHAVTQQLLDLTYITESGALNESLSDVFGSIAEHDLLGDGADNFRIGEAWLGPGETALRDMSDPYAVAEALRQPFHMKLFDRTSSHDNNGDWGGVHTNSGIPNFAFYLMVRGGSTCPPRAQEACTSNGITPLYITEGLGWTNARIVWSGVLETRGISPRASFADFARAQVAATQARLGRTTIGPRAMKTVACAWVGTGVIEADEARDNWNITCDGSSDAGTPSTIAGDCATDPAQDCSTKHPGQDLVCSWTGTTHCCRAPIADPATSADGGAGGDGGTAGQACYTDSDCGGGMVCARATNDATQDITYRCVAAGTSDCVQ